MKFIKDIFTDNASDWDIVSVMGCFLIVSLVALEFIDVFLNKQHFDMQSFGIAGAALLASLGGAYHWKANKSPAESQNQQ